MKILHTSDWHLGHRLHEHSQHEEQALFLTWLSDTISTEQVDVLVISGDIFDTGAPSNQSQKLYYDFLVSLNKTSCKHTFITGGNHDAPGMLNAPKDLLKALNVFVIGRASTDPQDEVFNVSVKDEHLCVAAVPYLRDQDIRRAVAGESYDDISARYKMALIQHYNAVSEICTENRTDQTFTLAMGHLFAIGGSTSESEQTIYVGNLGDIGADDFSKDFSYVALGHLHRPQRVGGKDHIRYSGSPYILSFSEVENTKEVVLLETQESELKSINRKEVPRFRNIVRVTGDFESCIAQIQNLAETNNPLKPWVEVVLDDDTGRVLGYNDVQAATENLAVEVLKVSLKNASLQKGLETLMKESKQVRELKPFEVFELKCKEQNIDLEQNQELKDAFSEILNAVQKN